MFSSQKTKLIPVMTAFFAMGFVDLIGIATNYVKIDFALPDTLASFSTVLLFFWFAALSVPTGAFMNKIGRKNTVVCGLVVTIAALVCPVVSYTFFSMALSFCLLGIGNTVLQVSLNPLASDIVSEKHLSSTLTTGNLVKATASFAAPVLASAAAVHYGRWQLIYPLFAAEAVIAAVLLHFQKIARGNIQKPTERTGCIALLKNPVVLICFAGIACHVGIDVGINIAAPALIMEKLNWPLERAAYATGVYFLARTFACLCGVFLLNRIDNSRFLLASALAIVLSTGLLVTGKTEALLFAGIILFGIGNANIFPVLCAKALLCVPDRKNNVSGLMITGLIGGAIVPPLMGIAVTCTETQTAAISVLTAGALFLAFIPHLLNRAPHTMK